MDPITAGRAMAHSLVECRAEGILTEEEFQDTVARCRTIEEDGRTPEEFAVEVILVTAFIAEFDRITCDTGTPAAPCRGCPDCIGII